MPSFRTVVTRIITFALATATVTTLLNILQALVLILAYKVTTVNVAISLSLPRISSVCVFASVIARDHLTDAVNRSTGAAAVMECFKVQLQNDCVTRIGDLTLEDEKDLPAVGHASRLSRSALLSGQPTLTLELRTLTGMSRRS